MKANELRIGNYVHGPMEEIMQIDVIGHINHPEYLHASGDGISGINGFAPIPLTDDWLNKFGFENGGYDLLFWRLNDFELAGNDFLNQGEEVPEYAYNWYLDDNIHKQILIKHVHQLQNLYFALTNEELTITQ